MQHGQMCVRAVFIKEVISRLFLCFARCQLWLHHCYEQCGSGRTMTRSPASPIPKELCNSDTRIFFIADTKENGYKHSVASGWANAKINKDLTRKWETKHNGQTSLNRRKNRRN